MTHADAIQVAIDAYDWAYARIDATPALRAFAADLGDLDDPTVDRVFWLGELAHELGNEAIDEAAELMDVAPEAWGI